MKKKKEKKGEVFAITLMPRPPPPKAALRITGNPYCLQNSAASSARLIGEFVPGTTGTPHSRAVYLFIYFCFLFVFVFCFLFFVLFFLKH
jgi:hypothetical protein